jgi:hypothetical protein
MRFRALDFALPLALAACGPGLNDQSLGAKALLTVEAHVDRGALVRQRPEAELMGALVWSAVPPLNEICLMLPDEPLLAAACLDPFGLIPGVIQAVAPLAADGTFTLDLFDLPASGVLVGTSAGHVAYGTFVVFEDVTNDGELSIPLAHNDFIGGGQPSTNGDGVLAASFHRQFVDQERLVFREGAYDAGSHFYRPCREPPRGFSRLVDRGYIADPATLEDVYAAPRANDAVCESRPAGERFEIAPLSEHDALSIECGANTMVFPMPADQWDPSFEQPGDELCLGDVRPDGARPYFVTVPNGECAQLSVVALRGCYYSLRCEDPEWDVPPPEGWPCR